MSKYVKLTLISSKSTRVRIVVVETQEDFRRIDLANPQLCESHISLELRKTGKTKIIQLTLLRKVSTRAKN